MLPALAILQSRSGGSVIASVGLYFAILADGAGVFPAAIKTFRRPDTEPALSYAISALAAILTLLALRSHSLRDVAYPAYLIVADGMMVVLAFRQSK